MNMKALLLAAALCALAGCAGGTTDGPTSVSLASTTETLVPSPTTSATSTTTTTAPSGQWQPPTVCSGTCDLEVLFEVPVGESGIGYANVGMEERQPYGPSALAATPDGNLWIADAVNNRLWQFSVTGETMASINLTEYEVAGPIDISAGPNGLLVLDVYPATQRYRVVQLDRDGHFGTAYDLPPGLWLQDGLTGVTWGPQGEIWVELEFGNRTAKLNVDGPSVTFEETRGYPYAGGTFAPILTAPFTYQAGSHQVALNSTAQLGGLSLLGVNPDGSFVLQMDEVTQDPDGTLRVTETIHLFNRQGEHQGAAVIPLADQFISVEHPLVVGPDGYTHALLTGPDSVVVVRLNYAG